MCMTIHFAEDEGKMADGIAAKLTLSLKCLDFLRTLGVEILRQALEDFIRLLKQFHALARRKTIVVETGADKTAWQEITSQQPLNRSSLPIPSLSIDIQQPGSSWACT